MMQTSGKYVACRKLATLFMDDNEPMNKFGAWNWILANASYRDHSTPYGKRIIYVRKGQVPVSFRRLKELFKWSQGRLDGFLKQLEELGIIVRSVDTGFLIITLCKYEEIQDLKTMTDTRLDIPRDTRLDEPSDKDFDYSRIKEQINKRKKAAPKRIEALPPLSSFDFRWHEITRTQLGAAQYKNWIRPLTFKNGYLMCPHQINKSWCENHYLQILREAVVRSGEEFKGFKLHGSAGVSEKSNEEIS